MNAGDEAIETASTVPYDVLRSRYAARLASILDSRSADSESLDRTISDRFRSIERLLRRRRIDEFRRWIDPRTPWQKALVELFLQARLRRYVLAYLSVQEAEDFEGRSAFDTRAPLFIAQLLDRVGRRSHVGIRPGIGRFRTTISLDPLIPLRRAYGRFLRERRGGPEGRRAIRGARYHRMMFRAKCRLFERIARTVVARFLRSGRGGIDFPGLASRPIRAAMATGVLVFFPMAERLDETQWIELLERLQQYFKESLERLRDALPGRSLRNHGLIKLAKVAFGTLVGRTAVLDPDSERPVDAIVDTCRLAYSWGITYPLVDNVLDDAEVPEGTKREIVSVLEGIFRGGSAVDAAAPGSESPLVREVRYRLSEVVNLLEPTRRDQTLATLANLLESHRCDASRRLFAAESEAPDRDLEVLADTLLKAALIRIATMAVCGIEISEATLETACERGLFNQLGDDLWDIYEDLDDDRVTPFTLYLSGKSTIDPFRLYLRYTARIAERLGPKRRLAAFLGCCETLRDALLTVSDRPSDPLEVEGHIRRSVDQCGALESYLGVRGVPHVDFDAVLFAFEAALLDSTRGRRQKSR